MPALETRFAPNLAEVVAKVIDGEAIIMNLHNGVYYSMDGVGGFIWERIEQARAGEEIVADLVVRYDISEAQARADVTELMAELLKEKVIVESNEASSAGGPVTEATGDRAPYARPVLQTYRDMGDLLALDPPAPGMQDIPWKA